nr:hypothetical protein [uncultured Mediterranean phage uvMED]
MGVINVEGLGQVEIKGVSPNEEEQQLILDALSETDGEGQQSIMPDLINPDLAEDRDTSPKGLELIGGRPTFEAAGAVFGGSVGGLGLNPVTMVAGGTLASAGGGQLYDIIQGSITGDSSTMEDQFGYLKKDLQREALLQTFFAKIPGFGTWAKSKLVNKNDKTKSLHKSAKEIGFPLSISDTGNMVAKGYGSVVGVFPLVGSPIKASVVTKANMLNKAADDTLNTFAPNVSLTNLGIDMVEASKSTFGDFKRVTSFLYDDFYNTASKMKAPIIPTESLKKSLTNYVNLVDDGIIKVNGKNIKSPNKDAIYKYAKSLKNVDPYINISQWKSLVRDMKKFAKLSSKEGYDQSTVFAFKGALEKDLNMLTNSKYLKSFEKVLNPQLMNDVRSKLLFANKVYANGLENSLVNKIVKDKNLKDFAKKKGVSLKETMTTIPGKNAFDSNVAKQFKRVIKIFLDQDLKNKVEFMLIN